MRHILVLFGILFTTLICESQELNHKKQPEVHTVVALEIIQTTNYTYLRVKEKENEKWLAIPKKDAKVGKTYYYVGGMLMVNFESKELKRTFEKVIFLAGISEEPYPKKNKKSGKPSHDMKKPDVGKKVIKVEPYKDGITIAKLYSNPKAYEGKVVKIRGKVVKYNAKILYNNWIHLQDGTEHKGKFDLTITTKQKVEVNDIIIIEGKVALNKDFGYGYKYDVMLEDAKIIY